MPVMEENSALCKYSINIHKRIRTDMLFHAESFKSDHKAKGNTTIQLYICNTHQIVIKTRV